MTDHSKNIRVWTIGTGVTVHGKQHFGDPGLPHNMAERSAVLAEQYAALGPEEREKFEQEATLLRNEMIASLQKEEDAQHGSGRTKNPRPSEGDDDDEEEEDAKKLDKKKKVARKVPLVILWGMVLTLVEIFARWVPGDVEPTIIPVSEWPWNISNNGNRAQAYNEALSTLQKDPQWIAAQAKENTTKLDLVKFKKFIKETISTIVKLVADEIKVEIAKSEEEAKETEPDLNLLKATVLSKFSSELNIKAVCDLTKSGFQGEGAPQQRRRSAQQLFDDSVWAMACAQVDFDNDATDGGLTTRLSAHKHKEEIKANKSAADKAVIAAVGGGATDAGGAAPVAAAKASAFPSVSPKASSKHTGANPLVAPGAVPKPASVPQVMGELVALQKRKAEKAEEKENKNAKLTEQFEAFQAFSDQRKLSVSLADAADALDAFGVVNARDFSFLGVKDQRELTRDLLKAAPKAFLRTAFGVSPTP